MRSIRVFYRFLTLISFRAPKNVIRNFRCMQVYDVENIFRIYSSKSVRMSSIWFRFYRYYLKMKRPTIEFLYRYANILEFNIDFRTILSRNDLRNPCNFIANKPPSIIQEWEIEGTDVVKIGSGIRIENYNQACIFSIMMNREKRKRKRKKSYENMIERVFRNFRWTKLRIKKRLFRSCPKS